MSIPPPDRPSPLAPGYRLDRYELLCPLAQGGMASVWVARQVGKHGFEKIVALKTILPQFASDFRFRRMFLDEAHIASSIEHSNVAHILDLGEQHDVLYLVMEWVDGDALSKLQRAVEKKNLAIPVPIVCRILADACGGLHAAHELRNRDGELLNVVHRDVSPQNILVNNKGIAKIIDFGIAKARDRVAEDTNAGVLKGKIQYMAPEQASGNQIDRRADVWAIGAILYHLLSGKTPFDAPNQLATLHRLTSGRPPLPLPQSVPKPVSDVVRATLLHDAKKRMGTAADLQAALEEAMHTAGIRATTNDVASFLREHLSERAENRKRSVELALKAAADRARVASVLTMPSADSSSGIVGIVDSNQKSNPDIGSLSDLERPKLSEFPTTLGVVAGQTGSSKIEVTPMSMGALPGRGKWLAIAGGIAVLVIGTAVVATSGKRTDPAPAAATKPIELPPATTVSVAPTPVIAVTAPPTTSVSASTTTTTATTVAAPTWKPTTKPTASSTPPGWKKIDDGF